MAGLAHRRRLVPLCRVDEWCRLGEGRRSALREERSDRDESRWRDEAERVLNGWRGMRGFWEEYT